jgi:hypothetical protein
MIELFEVTEPLDSTTDDAVETKNVAAARRHPGIRDRRAPQRRGRTRTRSGDRPVYRHRQFDPQRRRSGRPYVAAVDSHDQLAATSSGKRPAACADWGGFLGIRKFDS